MGHKLDRIMYEVSVVYIALPVFIFLAGWLRLVVAIPVCAVFLISLYFMLKNRPEQIAWHLTKANRRVIIVSLIILAVWVFFSGQGGFSFQNNDYNYRNAIFHDLIEKSWPVIYPYSLQNAATAASAAGTPSTAILTYYIAFWLPGALVGKLFGWYAANAFLYFWSLLGVTLIVYYLFRTLRNVSIWSVVILIFFSGMDIVGYLFMSKGKLPGPIDHIEWWSGLQYSSNTTLLFWVFNQTITIWLAILLIMNLKNSRSLFFMYAMLLLHGPFPFLGMLPIVLWKAYQGYPLAVRRNSKQAADAKGRKTELPNAFLVFILWFWNGIRRALTFENLAGGISVLVIVYLYLSKNASGSIYGINKWSPNYVSFIVFEAGLYLLFLFAEHRKNPLYWICIGSLLLIPVFIVGTSQDFCMRVSIPALFMTMIMIQQVLLGRTKKDNTQVNIRIEPEKAYTITENGSNEPEQNVIVDEQNTESAAERFRYTLTDREKKFVRCILIAFLIIGSVVPLQEMTRSVVYTLPAYPVTKSAMVSLGKALQDSSNQSILKAGTSILMQSQYPITVADSVKTLASDGSALGNFRGQTKDNLFYEYLARQ